MKRVRMYCVAVVLCCTIYSAQTSLCLIVALQRAACFYVLRHVDCYSYWNCWNVKMKWSVELRLHWHRHISGLDHLDSTNRFLASIVNNIKRNKTKIPHETSRIVNYSRGIWKFENIIYICDATFAPTVNGQYSPSNVLRLLINI